MPLVLDTKAPPEPGTKLQTGETNVAEITSAAYSPALNKVVALAYVRTEQARPHTEIQLGEIRAEVVAPTAG
jgi:glycine cleavage system aminomethyltransferase T